MIRHWHKLTLILYRHLESQLKPSQNVFYIIVLENKISHLYLVICTCKVQAKIDVFCLFYSGNMFLWIYWNNFNTICCLEELNSVPHHPSLRTWLIVVWNWTNFLWAFKFPFFTILDIFTRKLTILMERLSYFV